jgi:hypothetical protein
LPSLGNWKVPIGCASLFLSKAITRKPIPISYRREWFERTIISLLYTFEFGHFVLGTQFQSHCLIHQGVLLSNFIPNMFDYLRNSLTELFLEMSNSFVCLLRPEFQSGRAMEWLEVGIGGTHAQESWWYKRYLALRSETHRSGRWISQLTGIRQSLSCCPTCWCLNVSWSFIGDTLFYLYSTETKKTGRWTVSNNDVTVIIFV